MLQCFVDKQIQTSDLSNAPKKTGSCNSLCFDLSASKISVSEPLKMCLYLPRSNIKNILYSTGDFEVYKSAIDKNDALGEKKKCRLAPAY